MADHETSIRRTYLWWIFAALWFAGWHFLHTWQAWVDPVRRVPGPIGDNMVMLWNLGWVRHALSHGNPGFWFENAYYPEGFLFLYGTHTWLDGLLGWIFSPVLPGDFGGPTLWANITMAVATVGSGLLLIGALRAWGIRQWPVLILAASGAVFSWFRMFALMGHYHFYGTQWMLLSICLASYGRLAWREQRDARARKLIIASGGALGVAFLNDQTMAVFAGILNGLIVVSGAMGSGLMERVRGVFTKGVLLYGMALVPASIHLVPVVVALHNGSLEYSVNTDVPRLVDGSSLVLPPAVHWLGPALTGLRDEHGLAWSEGSYLGLVPMFLLGIMTIGAVRFVVTKPDDRPRQLRVCFYAAICAWGFLMLALGDTLMVGRESFNAMPGRLLKALPVINNIRMPQRWVWPAHLCIALGGASGLGFVLARFRSGWVMGLPLVIAMVPPLEGVRYPFVAPADFRNDPFLRPPGLMEAVQARYDDGGVLLMPAEIAYAHSNVFQFQWGYDIPVTIAYTARMPFTVQELPWKGNQWSAETGAWLREKEVSMIVFSFHDGMVEEYQPWIAEAKRAVPGVVVLNRFGEEI